MFFILRKTVKTINNQTKLYFVDKVQEYDYLITQKEEQLEEIDKEIKEKESQKEEKELYGGTSNYEFDYNIIDLINKTKYQDKNIFTINKKIDEKFNLDYEAIIKKFLENTSGKEQYDFCNNLKNKFTSEMIYLLKSLPNNDQEQKIKELLTLVILIFGGLSIHIQVANVLNDYNIDYKNFYLAKIIMIVLSISVLPVLGSDKCGNSRRVSTTSPARSPQAAIITRSTSA